MWDVWLRSSRVVGRCITGLPLVSDNLPQAWMVGRGRGRADGRDIAMRVGGGCARVAHKPLLLLRCGYRHRFYEYVFPSPARQVSLVTKYPIDKFSFIQYWSSLSVSFGIYNSTPSES